MSKFKVGEIAIGCNFILSQIRNGMECEIVGPLQKMIARHFITNKETTGYRYLVLWADGSETAEEPHYLRHKNPPQSSWEELADIWDPTKETV